MSDQLARPARKACSSIPRTTSPQSVQRAFQLLELLAEAGGASTISDLAAVSGLPMPTVHRLVSSMRKTGHARQDRNRRYTLGPRLIRLGEAATRQLGRWARPYLEEASKATGETVSLVVWETGNAMCIDEIASRYSVRMSTGIGQHMDLHCTAAGKTLLAQIPEDEARAIIGSQFLAGRTPFTATDPSTVLRRVDVVRRMGYGVDDEESEVGVRGVAVPIPGSPLPAAVSVYGPATRISLPVNSRNNESDLIVVMLGIAASLGETLSGPTGERSRPGV